MKSKSDVRHWSTSSVAVACGLFVALGALTHAEAADKLHRLDAPGPGYREQSARVKTPPEYLRPITEGHPASPKNTFDGVAPLRIEPLRSGEFRNFPESFWDGGPHREDYGIPRKSDTFYFEPLLRGAESIQELPATPVRGEIRLPQIPEVILPHPGAMDSSKLETNPFEQPLSVELRASR